MTRRPVRTLAVLTALSLGLLIVAVPPQPAYACSCADISDQPADQADAIFIGRVLSEESIHKPSPGRTDLRFEVSQVYKGTVYQEQVVASPRGSDGCGVDFQVGSTWLVFAEDRIEGTGSSQVFRLVTQQCSGNQPGSTAPDWLGSGHAPLQGASDRDERAQVTDARLNRGLHIVGWVVLALAGVAVAGVAALWRPGRAD